MYGRVSRDDGSWKSEEAMVRGKQVLGRMLVAACAMAITGGITGCSLLTPPLSDAQDATARQVGVLLLEHALLARIVVDDAGEPRGGIALK